MEVHQTQSVEVFARRSLLFLQQREAEHNLLLALLSQLQHHPLRRPPCFLTVEHEGAAAAVAIQTAHAPLLLSCMTHPHCGDALVHHIVSCWPSPERRLRELLSHFAGPKWEAAMFAQSLRRRTRLTYRRGLEMRIHQLRAVNAIAPVPGRFRSANEGDRPLLASWYRTFEAETQVHAREDADLWVERRLAQADLFVWEVEPSEPASGPALGPVCMAGGSAFSSEAGRLGPVYTPPEHRRQGYGTAMVAALSQQLLDQGCRICYLFTDVKNPTSNHIYRLVGYERVCDWDEYHCREA